MNRYPVVVPTIGRPSLVPLLRQLATGGRRLARVAGAAWAAGTAEFAVRRIAPGPRSPREIVTMAATSALIPPLAVGHWLRGWYHHRGAR